MRVISRAVGAIVRVRCVLANGVDVVEAGTVQVDKGRASLLGGDLGRTALVGQRVGCVVLGYKVSAGKRRYQYLAHGTRCYLSADVFDIQSCVVGGTKTTYGFPAEVLHNVSKPDEVRLVLVKSHIALRLLVVMSKLRIQVVCVSRVTRLASSSGNQIPKGTYTDRDITVKLVGIVFQEGCNLVPEPTRLERLSRSTALGNVDTPRWFNEVCQKSVTPAAVNRSG